MLEGENLATTLRAQSGNCCGSRGLDTVLQSTPVSVLPPVPGSAWRPWIQCHESSVPRELAASLLLE